MSRDSVHTVRRNTHHNVMPPYEWGLYGQDGGMLGVAFTEADARMWASVPELLAAARELAVCLRELADDDEIETMGARVAPDEPLMLALAALESAIATAMEVQS